MGASARAVCLAKSFEDMRQDVLRHALTGILDDDLDVRVHALQAQLPAEVDRHFSAMPGLF